MAKQNRLNASKVDSNIESKDKNKAQHKTSRGSKTNNPQRQLPKILEQLSFDALIKAAKQSDDSSYFTKLVYGLQVHVYPWDILDFSLHGVNESILDNHDVEMMQLIKTILILDPHLFWTTMILNPG